MRLFVQIGVRLVLVALVEFVMNSVQPNAHLQEVNSLRVNHVKPLTAVCKICIGVLVV